MRFLQSCLKLEGCKGHKAAYHPMKLDVINGVKLFATVYDRIYCCKVLTLSNQMWRYKSNCISVLHYNDDIFLIYCGTQGKESNLGSFLLVLLIVYAIHEMGLIARKPVFWGLQTTKAQTSLRIQAVCLATLLFSYCKVYYIDLLQAKF